MLTSVIQKISHHHNMSNRARHEQVVSTGALLSPLPPVQCFLLLFRYLRNLRRSDTPIPPRSSRSNASTTPTPRLSDTPIHAVHKTHAPTLLPVPHLCKSV